MNPNLLSWLLYDAGNSFVVSATSSLFLGQWLALDKGVPELWYGTVFSLATVFVLLTSPFLGAWSDLLKRRKPFLVWLTLVLFVATGLLPVFTNVPLSRAVVVPVVLVLFFVFQYAYQISFVFFNPLIDTLATPKTRGAISGLSQIFNQTAFVLANALLLLFALGKIIVIGTPGRSQVFLPAFVLFALLAFPFLWKFREKEFHTKRGVAPPNVFAIWKKTLAGLTDLTKRERNVARFLIGFSFVSDGILSISLYFALVMNTLYQLPDTKKFIVITLMFLCAGIGGLVWGKIADRSNMKGLYMIQVILLIASFSLAFLHTAYPILLIAATGIGLSWGGFYTLGRALLIRISPKEQLAEYFGLYSTFERFASIVGPTLWGLVVLALNHNAFLKYRAAGFAEIGLMIVGLIILIPVKDKRWSRR